MYQTNRVCDSMSATEEKKEMTWKTLTNLENNCFHSSVQENVVDNEQIDILQGKKAQGKLALISPCE